jgi:hypothetical protein
MEKTYRSEFEDGDSAWDEERHLLDRYQNENSKGSGFLPSTEGDFKDEESAWAAKYPPTRPQREISKTLGFLSIIKTIIFFYFRNYSSFQGTQPSTKSAAKEPAAIKYNQLPYWPTVADDFVGRIWEVQDLDSYLSPPTPTPGPRVASIIGQAGIGKAQLALKYSRDHFESYDVIL